MKLALLLALLAACLPGQTPAAPAADSVAAYRLGPSDEVVIRVLGFTDEIGDKPFRVDPEGEISLPMLGGVHAGGLTVAQLQAELVRRFKKDLLDPQVTVSISSFRSQPVSVLGYVTTPGVLQVESGKTLFEVLSLAGGLKPEAGSIIIITRRKEQGSIPLPGATLDASGAFTVARVSAKSIMTARNPAENIVVRPNDVITVPKGEIVHAIGAVRTPGGFVLGDRDTLSVLQAIALSQGLAAASSPKKARILRGMEGATAKLELPVDVKAILDGKAADISLGPNDVLYIPSAQDVRSGGWKAAGIAAQIGSVALWRF
jgi:polysaccharide export outer membrane protein